MAKFTEADVKELAALMHKNTGGVAFLTGAGCSKSAGIPMARDLVEQINHDFKESVQSFLEPSKRSEYGACMGILSSVERERLIKPYLENAKINWAHIALASLIQKEFVSRVLTFNFDSVLAHACGLLGKYPATYDFGISPSDRTDYLARPCIVHLHGQGYGPVMMNSDEDTQDHAEKLTPLLTDTLNSYPLIVVGYSGEADKVFEKLTSLYNGRHRLYWLGFSEEPKEHLRAFFDGKHKKLCHYIGGADADQFLIQLAQQLNCFPPQVFASPAGHLLAEMKDIAPYPLNEADTTDILKNTIERLKKYETVLLLNPNQTAVLSNNPADIDIDENTPAEIAAWALVEIGNKHFEAAEKTNSISEYEKTAQQYEAALKIKPDMHEALNNWGNALSGLAKLQNAPDLFKASFAKYEAALKIKPDKHVTLYNWGNALLHLAQLKQEPALFDACFAKYEASLKIKPDYHEALLNWGAALSDLAQLKREPALFDASFAKYEASLKIKPDDHKALYNWGTTLSDLAQLKQEPALFDASFAKYEASLKIKPDNHKVLNNWVHGLIQTWKLTKDTKYLEQATKVTSQAEKLSLNDCYNGACLAAIKNDEDGCKERLLRAKAAKTLPTRKHLEKDDDLVNMRDKPWFAELLKDL
jgi:tetratricopeptide (TPR) repeat protein